MLDSLAISAVVMAAMNALFGGLALRRAQHLEEKLREFARLLFVHGLAVALVWVAFVVRLGQAPRFSRVGEPGVDELRARLLALGEHERHQTMQVASLPLILLLLLPAVLHVLRELRGFVAAQRVDLLARDQAAAWKAAGKAESGADRPQ